MDSTATYRLKRYLAGRPHWAQVTVEAEASDHDRVSAGDDVFGWRRDTYGPDAAIGGVEDDRLVAEALDGVGYLLSRPVRRNRYAVTVTRIVDSLVDTMDGDVKLAAALACMEALGVTVDDPPRLEPAGAVFP